MIRYRIRRLCVLICSDPKTGGPRISDYKERGLSWFRYSSRFSMYFRNRVTYKPKGWLCWKKDLKGGSRCLTNYCDKTGFLSFCSDYVSGTKSVNITVPLRSYYLNLSSFLLCRPNFCIRQLWKVCTNINKGKRTKQTN